MSIVEFQEYMIEDVVKLWNDNVYNKTIYKKIDKSIFFKTFLNNKYYENKYTLVYKKNDKIIGFINGTVNPQNSQQGHITCIIVDEKHQRNYIGTKLLNNLEKIFKDNGIKHIRQIFFNPINLEWIIPHTKQHDHPNSPGVDYNSDFYLFLINNGFNLDGDNQDVYYLNIEEFEYSNKVKNINKKISKLGYKIEFYNKERHYGYEELFADLNNDVWLDVFINNIDENPMLVVVRENEILGWTGPLYTQESKRGYFAGIGIHSKLRGKGIGTSLFEELLMQSKNNGAKFMSLFTGSKNPARNIYLNSGFKIVKSFAILGKEI